MPLKVQSSEPIPKNVFPWYLPRLWEYAFPKSMLLFSVIEPLKFSGVIGFMEYCRSRADSELF